MTDGDVLVHDPRRKRHGVGKNKSETHKFLKGPGGSFFSFAALERKSATSKKESFTTGSIVVPQAAKRPRCNGWLSFWKSPRVTTPNGCGSKPMGSHFGVGEFTTHLRTYFSGDWDVHWGYDLDFDPWPNHYKP